MNCCDANGKCTGGLGCAARSTAKDGALRFAPGQIDAYRRPLLGTPAQRRELGRWVLVLAGFGAVAVVAAFAVGVIAGRLP